MILNNAEKKDVTEIIDAVSGKLIKDPLFMYFCSDVNEREKFIEDYLKYYIYEWSKYDNLLCSENKQVLISLVNPRTFEYRFKGKGAHSLKKNKSAAKAIFRHRKIVRGAVHIITPGSMNPRVMNIYGNADTNIDEIDFLVNEAIETAKAEQTTLVYETFSQKLIPLMESKGFSIAYQKNFYDTRFLQTIMVLFPNK
ncbi:MAG: hypothetical protein ACLUFN_03745 [Eubacterium sp.]